jgi:hypothetical protein
MKSPELRLLVSLFVLATMVFGNTFVVSAMDFAKAENVKVRDIYHAKIRPGYCCWVSLWSDAKGAVYLSFVEKRRAPNPNWEPLPLDFWESMSLPHGYHTALSNGSKDIVYEIVVLKSTDQGDTWQEIGRSPSQVDNSFSWVTLSNGSLLRSQSNDYIAWHKGDRQQTWCETSDDGGNSWKKRASIYYGHNGSGSPHRLRQLRDGTLVQLISAAPEFGPGKERFARHTKRPNVRQELAVYLYFSKDQGQTWTGPLPVFPGIMAWEPDFVELPSGDLLLLNSAVQPGPQVRQYVRKTELGWIPSPVFDVVHGQVPETVARTKSGILVGAVRGGKYTCSNDDGEHWYPVANIPNAEYQPYILALADDRLLCAAHCGGGDEAFGKHDLYVAATSFSLASNLPRSTNLSLTRNLSPAGDRYINGFTATLSQGEQPLAGQKILFKHSKNEGGESEVTAITDDRGQATLDLTSAYQGIDNIHTCYRVRARFVPDANQTGLASCESDEYFAYAITTSKADLGHPK